MFEIQFYPESFFLLRDVIVFITYISLTGISFISVISSTLVFSNSYKALCKPMDLLLKFSTIYITNLLKTLAVSVVSVIRPASEFILVTDLR